VSAVRDCFFNIFAATLHIGGRSSIRNRRKPHAVVTGPNYHGVLHILTILPLCGDHEFPLTEFTAYLISYFIRLCYVLAPEIISLLFLLYTSKHLILQGVLLAAPMESDIFILPEFLLEEKINSALCSYRETVECILHLSK
jgi:hypothetical protein